MSAVPSTSSSTARIRRFLAALVATTAVWSAILAPPAVAEPAAIRGSGSTYVALAMAQWVADAQTSGLRISYQALGSPQGLEGFNSGIVDFAGTEAEYASLGSNLNPARGYQYTPDVAGAVAIMYNAKDTANRQIDYLQLSRRTIARIFMGDITLWSDPAIAADNQNKVRLPDQPIKVLFRAGRSGTTALFYDFVAHSAPDLFPAWAARNNLPTAFRIIDLSASPHFTPNNEGLGDSDLIARDTKRREWTISYDEFGYAVTYDVPVAWVDNDSGVWTKPYARNISAALESAGLRPDLTQELSKVYASKDPEAYPISAYSYIVTQCASTPDRPTCKGPYPNPGTAETLQQWMRYIACEGQANMARIGYSPLPPNLSQEIANSIARMTGGAPEQLHAGNCANPRFTGNIPGPPEKPPLSNVPEPGAAKSGATGPTSTVVGPATATTLAVDPSAPTEVAAAPVGKVRAANGGGTEWRDAQPVAYVRPGVPFSSGWALAALLGVILVPPLAIGAVRLRRRTR